MATNKSPIFVNTPQTAIALSGTAANTAMDGTGTVVTICTAAADGSFLERIRVKPLGSNVTTVMRFFVNNGGATSTAANNALFEELNLPTTTASNSAAQPTYDVFFGLKMKAGYKVTCTIGTAVAAGFALVADISDYT